jgi:RNA polymerase sigma factor (sigma-70 family)
LRPTTPIDPESVVSRTAPIEVHAELTQLYGVLDRMKPEVRTALVLHRVEGMSVPEVAEAMQVSASTVKRRLSAGRKRLAKFSKTAGAGDE